MHIDELLSAEPFRREKVVRLEGFKAPFVLHELLANEQWAINRQESEASKAKKPVGNEFYARYVLMSLTGYEVEPTDEEVSKFCSKFGHSVIESLYLKLIDWSDVAEKAKDARKNS
ncbi:MAG: hypothetical protein CME36_09715 [unclassified Hahellaceae]|nr:hypothetical protein [Hahellaceae bacterium]|tara:strand:- start:35944 stop:36291 length:348 start_codon:yes stop_codon:yes gene_type:complete